jgi:hypothetical protein
MHVFITNLHEDAARLVEQLSGDGKAVAQVGQVGVDA